MIEKFEKRIKQCRYHIYRTFVFYLCGMATEDEVKHNINVLHHELDLDLRNDYKSTKEEREEAIEAMKKLFCGKEVGYEDVKLLREDFEANTDSLTIHAMKLNYCTVGQDKEKAKEEILLAAQKGDFFATVYAQKQKWIS